MYVLAMKIMENHQFIRYSELMMTLEGKFVQERTEGGTKMQHADLREDV